MDAQTTKLQGISWAWTVNPFVNTALLSILTNICKTLLFFLILLAAMYRKINTHTIDIWSIRAQVGTSTTGITFGVT